MINSSVLMKKGGWAFAFNDVNSLKQTYRMVRNAGQSNSFSVVIDWSVQTTTRQGRSLSAWGGVHLHTRRLPQLLLMHELIYTHVRRGRSSNSYLRVRPRQGGMHRSNPAYRRSVERGSQGNDRISLLCSQMIRCDFNAY